MKKFNYIAAVALLAMTTLAACGTKEEKNVTETTPATQTETTPAVETADKTVTIEHSLGTVTVPVNPEKVAVFDYGMLDNIRALDVDAELAVVAENIPAYLSEYALNTSIGTLKEPDLEAIFEFEPDVIIISGRQSSYYEQLSEIAPTVFVEIDSTKYLEDFEKNLNIAAQIFEKEDAAKLKMNAINKKVEEVKVLSANLESKALILLTNDGSISAYGQGSRFGLIHDLLGIKAADENIEASTHGMEANYEYISSVNPDIIFVVDRTEATSEKTVEATEETTSVIPALDNELVNNTNAAKNGKIVKLNAEVWYKAGGGVASLVSMMNEIKAAIQ